MCDNDSLFGSPSPPSSPVRGRSPPLALPSAAAQQGDNSTLKNVGTIALPGSHLFSELAHNPTALSLSHVQKSAHRPPAQTIRHQRTRPQLPIQPQIQAGNKRKKTSRENSPALVHTRPPPPPIHLPDPNAPPPANFLRNQQALLGLAGLIGHVNPSRLSRAQTPGDAVNPIVIDESDEVGNVNIQGKAKEVVRPSNEEIVGMLIRDKNVLPILESILQIIHKHVPATTDQHEPTPELAPKKKRKINPATAMEQEKTKHLLSQLCTMIKNAAHKATLANNHHAAKSRKFQPRFFPPQEDKIMGHYRARTALYGRSTVGEQGQEVIMNRRDATRCELSPVPSSLGSGNAIEVEVGSSQSSGSSASEEPQVITPEFSSLSPTPEFDGAAFESWMSVLEKFPDPVFQGNWDASNVDVESLFASGSTPNDIPFDSFSSPDFAIDPALLGLAPPPPALLSPSSDQPPSFGVIPPLPSLTPTSPTNTDWTMGPITPIAQEQGQGTFSDPELEKLLVQMEGVDSTSGESVFSGQGQQKLGMEGVGGMFADDPELERLLTEMVAWQGPNAFLHFNSNTNAAFPESPIDPVLASFDLPFQPPRPLHPKPPTPVSNPSQPLPTASTVGPPFKMPTRVSSTTRIPNANKQDILKRAKERRMQLLGEIDRAKVELWETTIEQGVLANIIKEKI